MESDKTELPNKKGNYVFDWSEMFLFGRKLRSLYFFTIDLY